MRSIDRVTDALGGRKKALAYFGATAALVGAGAGTASAAVVASPAHNAPAAHHAVAAAAKKTVSQTSSEQVAAAKLVAAIERAFSAKHVASAKHPAAVKHVAAAKFAAAAKNAGKPAVKHAGKQAAVKPTWQKVEQVVAHDNPGLSKQANELQPVGDYGPQQAMPLTSSQFHNARTIVNQALAKKMGIRSAVIAVATSMQESTLNNLGYGDRDSLGLFQQRPSMGWGTAQQILTPKYAADAFLNALHKHEAADPMWARQPLWANAQSVQASGFPTAYAKWEAAASHVVQQVVTADVVS